jgi:CRISPR-associated protein Cmr2
MTTYTAVSFAPVQGFIEKSRKLRDLYGSSLILSYLSQSIAQIANALPDCTVISPALINVQEGMPNRILIRGDFPRNDMTNAVVNTWGDILNTCKTWLETQVPNPNGYEWEAEWQRWKQYTWEIFWGQGDNAEKAMRDLERRKLKRDWTGVNWIGESSSLTGTDAIAWSQLGTPNPHPSRSLNPQEKQELTGFYNQLAWVLDNPQTNSGKLIPSDVTPEGRYIAPNERLSIPELVKRLVTLPRLANELGMTILDEGFTDVNRDQWTGWFMGDGDRVGNYLKTLDDESSQRFSESMRNWGTTFKETFDSRLGRVIYAGGDDFLGVLYSQNDKTPLEAHQALKWLQGFPTQWNTPSKPITVSVGFVWAGKRVPQRDILQHCREAEKRSKTLDRDRVTLRVVFNSGQFIQWTCPWELLHILNQYCDRDGGQNWTHIYKDWAMLKSRHAIRLKEGNNPKNNPIDSYLARQMLNFYFNGAADKLSNAPRDKSWKFAVGEDTELAIVQWIDDLINVGWQLCSNS